LSSIGGVVFEGGVVVSEGVLEGLGVHVGESSSVVVDGQTVDESHSQFPDKGSDDIDLGASCHHGYGGFNIIVSSV
jgi:hypothetical protein